MDFTSIKHNAIEILPIPLIQTLANGSRIMGKGRCLSASSQLLAPSVLFTFLFFGVVERDALDQYLHYLIELYVK